MFFEVSIENFENMLRYQIYSKTHFLAKYFIKFTSGVILKLYILNNFQLENVAVDVYFTTTIFQLFSAQ